jgi:outer membrane protein insertion porin family
MHQRADGSGRHVLGVSGQIGVAGNGTPVFEHFFAGGTTTLRGFSFRGASPVKMGTIVGGEFQMLGSVEYLLPLTADDALRAVIFCDFGTVEEDVRIDWDEFRVAPGFGLRISVPALGPAPIALDIAIPVNRAPTDDIQQFSFRVGLFR